MRKRRLLKKDPPKGIKPFNWLGADLKPQQNSDNWIGDCPFCGGEEKFFVNEERSVFDCKSCGIEGNQITFMTRLASELREATLRRQFVKLGQERGTVKVDGHELSYPIPVKVLSSFKMVWDDINEGWLVPCFSPKGDTVRSMRRYKRKQMRAIAGVDLQLGGMERLQLVKKGGKVWLCEGEWDAVAMALLLQESGRDKDQVVWVPGSNCMREKWAATMSGYDIIAVYDNDTAGEKGALKAYKHCNGVVNSIKFVHWPDGLPNKFDLRDYIISNLARDVDPQKLIKDLESLVEKLPKRMEEHDGDVDADDEEEEDDGKPPASLEEVLATFEANMLMDDELRMALKVMLAVTCSNDMGGDPLWVYIVGPPGAGKTMLLSALQESKRCKFVSTMSPHCLVSGWQGSGAKDPSLIPRLKGKTFVAKDWTEVLSMPGPIQEEIFSTLRGAYDGFVQRPFGNGVMREYRGCFFSMLAGVTNAIHGSSKASLGERFLKFQMNAKVKGANDIVMSAIANVGKERQIEEDMQEVTKRFLKLRMVDPPRMPDHFIDRLVALVQLIAILRAQVERDWRGDKLAYRPVPEAGTRLAKQLTKMAIMLAFIEGQEEVKEEQYRIVEKMAFDTAYGFHFDIISTMMEMGGQATRKDLVEVAEVPHSTLALKLEDLLILKAVIKMDAEKKPRGGGRPAVIYKVADRVADLWLEARGERKWEFPKKSNKRRRRKRALQPS